MMKRIKKFHGKYIRHAPYHYFLGLLAIFLLGYPFIIEFRVGREVLAGFLMMTMLLGIFSSSRTKTVRAIAILIATPAIVLLALYLSESADIEFPLVGLATLLVVIFTLGNVLAYVLRQGPVSEDRIAAAVCAYLLTGLLFAGFYAFTDAYDPKAFIALGGGQRMGHFYEFVYFSFTTLTSTGYGDIAPVSYHARSLANAEQLVGTFYIALLIARLTGLYQSSRQKAGE